MKQFYVSCELQANPRSVSDIAVRQFSGCPGRELFLAIILLFASHTILASGEGKPEYAVKAAYLYNFLKFVRWPAESEMSSGDALTVCILGVDPFGLLLEPLSKREIRGHMLRIRRLNSTQAIADCALVFVTDVAMYPPDILLEKIRGKGVLLVGDAPDFARSGGMLGFVTTGQKIKLEINQESLALSDLEVSAMLLEVATLVGAR